jgi:hypothetical protein
VRREFENDTPLDDELTVLDLLYPRWGDETRRRIFLCSNKRMRGQAPNFTWLVDHGLAEIIKDAPPHRMLAHRLTDKGRAELREHGICERCGNHGTYYTGDYVTPWQSCDHGRSEA